MRETLKVGEHIIIEGKEYVAEEHNEGCDSCDLYNSSHCYPIPCRSGLRLKRVEIRDNEVTEEMKKELVDFLKKYL